MDSLMDGLSPLQWAVLCLGAFGVGLSKTGIAGLGVLTVAVFALIIPSKESTGVVLPILIAADLVAVTVFKRHAVWSHLARLFPWTAVGVILGWLVMGRLSNDQVSHLIGAILVVMVLLHYGRQYRASKNPDVDDTPTGVWFAIVMGLLAGFTTMVANAAGPVMILYLLSMRLPKMAFIGTSAWFFFSVNLFKLPFSGSLGLINPASLTLFLRLAPFAVGGALFGRYILRYIPQKLFEHLALIFTVIAAIKLLLA